MLYGASLSDLQTKLWPEDLRSVGHVSLLSPLLIHIFVVVSLLVSR